MRRILTEVTDRFREISVFRKSTLVKHLTEWRHVKTAKRLLKRKHSAFMIYGYWRFYYYSRTPLFRTRLIRSPRYFEGRLNSLGFTLMFSVIYYQLFRTRLFRILRYFELIVLSLHLKSTPLFRTCQKQEYVHKSTAGNVLHFIWARTEHPKSFQCNSVCWFIRHIITVFLFNQCLSSYSTVFSLSSILRFPGYFETPLLRTFFHFPWDFEIAGFNCSNKMPSQVYSWVTHPIILIITL